MKITKGFGKRVQMTRSDMGATQLAFAKMSLSCGASSQNIGRIEREDVTPRASTLEKIATVSGVDVAWLITGKTAVKPSYVVKTSGIGARISKYRKARGLTCRALAEASGLGESSKNISRLETGEVRPRGATLSRVASALGVSVNRLANGA